MKPETFVSSLLEAGFSEKQSQRLVSVVDDMIEIKTVEIGAKIDLAVMKMEMAIHREGVVQIRWMVGSMFGLAALIIAGLKLLH